ncbi:MAG: ABC transporter permease [Saprospiraceae bacterium]
MFRNYLKIAFRSFKKQQLTSMINIVGLSIGIACAGMGFVFIQHELSYDRFHDEAENIFWLSASIENKVNISSSPGPLSPALKDAIPEVSEFFRMEEQAILVQSGQEFFQETGHFVDPNFFTFFSFDLIAGDPDRVLAPVNAIVLNESSAEKYFGRLSPVGKDLTLNYQGEEVLFEVTGVMADAPQNSSLQCDFLLPLAFLYKDKPEVLVEDWTQFPVTSFIRLKKENDLLVFQEKMEDLTANNTVLQSMDDSKILFNVRALQNYHLKDGYPANGLTAPADMSYVRILGIIAVLILLVACFNFMNLANAKGSGRLSEVGVRRVLGADRKQLISQFLSEAIFTSMLALGLGCMLIRFSLPYISTLTGFSLEISWLRPYILLPLLGIALVAGALAGLYPAILLSKLRAVQAFQSRFKTGGNNMVTKSSLVFQFAVSIGLLSCTFIMYRQQQYIKNHNLGFDQEMTVVIPTQSSYREGAVSQRLVDQFRTEVLADPNVLKVSGVSGSFGGRNAALFVEGEGGSWQNIVFFYNTDSEYIPLLAIELIAGRNFEEGSAADQEDAIIVNETFLKEFDIDIDQTGSYRLPEKFKDQANARIIGVVKDYNYLDLKSEMKPLMLKSPREAYLGNILVKIRPEEVDETLASLRRTWQKINASKPFEFSFLDEDIQQQYLVEQRWNKAITGATVLAVLIACLGLFGLLALILAERTKEIGIRKILGATIPDITWLVSRQFVLLLGIAAVVALPIAWWSMQKWLENFAYKINIGFLIFVAAIGVTCLIALLTAGLQAVKAAMQNPVEALRNE